MQDVPSPLPGAQASPPRPLDAAPLEPEPRDRFPLLLSSAIGAGLLVIGAVLLLVHLRPASTEQNVQGLTSSDPTISTQALEALAEATPQASQRARVTAALEPLLFDGDIHHNLRPDLLLRVYLAWADRSNVPALVRMVENPTLPSWTSRSAVLVMEALGRLRDDRAIGTLATKLPDPDLHDAAVNALTVMRARAEPTVLGYLFHPDRNVRLRASRLLAGYGTRPEAIAAEALNELRSSQADVRATAVVWFVDNSPADDASKTAAAPALAGLLTDPEPDTRNLALRALVRWGTRDSLPKLLDYARTEQKTVSGDPLLIDVLAQIPDESAADAIALQLANPLTRARAAKALLGLGPVGVKAVLRYIDSPDDAVQNEARDLCRLLEVPADRVLDQTLADATSSEIPRACAALRYLARMRADEASRSKVSKALNAPLADAHKEIREGALQAVKVWGSPENTVTLLGLLGDFHKGGPGRNVRISEILGLIKDPAAAPTLVQGLDHHEEQVAARRALLSLGAAAEPAVLPLLESGDQGTQVVGCQLLAEIGTLKSLPALRGIVRQAGFGDGFVFDKAQTAIERITARNP